MMTDRFAHIPLFSNLTQKTRLAISRLSYIQNYPSGYTLLIEGVPSESAYFLLSGEVRALKMNTEGRAQVLARFTAGDPINIISLLNEEKLNRGTIETLSPVTILVLPAAGFHKLVTNYPDFNYQLLLHLAERLSKMTNLAAGLSLYAVRARLARFLIDLADFSPTSSGWTQDEIAAHIGTVRDVVGRLLREFESTGLIQRQRGQIILLDREKLKQAAQK